MLSKILKIILIVLINCLWISAYSQISNYDIENWSGKNSVVKDHISLPNNVIKEYNMTLTKGSRESSFFYKISLDENDRLKKGRLQVKVFSNIKDAQLALVEYLDCLSTPFKPPRLTDEDLIAGDVAFGDENNGIIRMAFVRNNVVVVIHAPITKAKKIAQEIDEKIQNAHEWKVDSLKPSFILLE